MSTIVVESHVPLDLIDVAENVRELDQAHVDALASSIDLRGLIVPLVVRPEGERFRLVAGNHRYAACRKLGLEAVEVTVREQEGSSADSAAENVVRKQLSPLEEARAVAHMLEEGYTLDGAATVLGWSSKLVSARAQILDLPQVAQQLLGSGALPVSAVGTVARIAEVSSGLCDAVLAQVAEGNLTGSEFANDPAWAMGHALREGTGEIFAAYLGAVGPHEITELRLGKKAEAAYAEAEELYKQANRYAYGPPPIRFNEIEVDQARAAGVLIEFEHGVPIITDRALYRELAKQAIRSTLQEQRAAKQADDTDRNSRRAHGKQERSPQEKLDTEHRATLRSLKGRAHGTNLDLGAALLQKLAVVDPGDMDVARFFAYGVLGPDTRGYLGKDDHTVATIAANGIRLVIEDHRTVTTPVLKSGKRGKTKVAYGEVEDAATWLWKFIEGAKSADELYGRVLVVFAAQHYTQNLVLPASQRRGSVLPYTRKDTARKAFERITKNVLPASHAQLQRALEREAREYAKRQKELSASARQEPDADTDSNPDVDGGEDSAEELIED